MLKQFWMTTGLLLLASAAPLMAWADGLVVAPTRLVLTPSQRTTEAAVTNTSKAPVRYRIELVDEVMTPSGTIQQVDKFDYSAKDMLRYMPKLVSIPAGGRQTIRLMANRPDGLADGDYHTHLMLEEIAAPRGAAPSTTLPDKGFSVDIQVAYSLGVPVLVQQGKLDGAVQLADATLVHNPAGKVVGLKATLMHTGNSEGVGYLTATTADGKAAIEPRIIRLYREVTTVSLDAPLLPAAITANPAQLTVQLHKGPGATEPVIGTVTAQ